MITRTDRGVVNTTTDRPICPRCGHRVLYHVTGKDDLVNPNRQHRITLTGCFVTDCGGCPNYIGDA